MDTTKIKAALFTQWENPKVRYACIGAVLLGVMCTIAFNTDDLDNGGEPIDKTEFKVGKKKKVEANFFTSSGADSIEENRMDEIYDLMEGQMAEREKSIDEREEEMKMMESRFLKELDSLKFKTNDLERELEIQKTANDDLISQSKPVKNTFSPEPAGKQMYGKNPEVTQQQNNPVMQPPSNPRGGAMQKIVPRKTIDSSSIGIRTISNKGDFFQDAQGNMLDQTPEGRKPEEEEVVKEEPKEKKPEPLELFLPAGSMISGVLITGMDVPTGSSVKSDPFPSVLRIKREALLPNNFRADIRECVIISSAIGDISSRRAYLRAEAISCVTDEGKAVEANLNAFAVGADGRNGIPGRLVSKNSEAAMKSAWAGFLAGIADLAGTSTISIGDNRTGAYGVFQSQEAMKTLAGSAALQGAGDAMNRLADYYIEIAEQMKPYIEVNPGINIDFIVQRGSSIRLE